VFRDGSGRSRYRLLETVREYGLARLRVGDGDGDAAGAVPPLEESVARFDEVGERGYELSLAKVSLGMAVLYQGDPVRAARLCAEACAISRENGDRWWLGYALISAALAALAVDDLAAADEYARESLRLRDGLGDTLGMAGSLERLAWIVAASGDMRRAARLLGAADRLWRMVDLPLWGSAQWQRGREKCEASARAVLGDKAFEAAFRHGAELSLAEAVSYALGGDRQPPAADAVPAEHTSVGTLTRREYQVAELVAQGLSNKEVATQLVISLRTAESHVQILRKLGFTSRSQIVGWVSARAGAPGKRSERQTPGVNGNGSRAE
jgi:DNA-binding CsgD family transcriptional regulator